MSVIAKLNQTKFKINLGFLSIEQAWEIDDIQRKAAWEMYVELATRISTAPLHKEEGLLREALSSLYSLFATTRGILKQYGPSIATPAQPEDTTFGHIAVGILNKILRPLLAKWHPILADWEDSKPEDRSRTEHERMWEHHAALREEINVIRQQLSDYAEVLATVSGVAKLT